MSDSREIVIPCLEDLEYLQKKCVKLGITYCPAKKSSSSIMTNWKRFNKEGTKSQLADIKASSSREKTMEHYKSLMKKAGSSKWSDKKYEVETILDYVVEEGQKWYLVKWKGWHEDCSTWEPRDNLQDCKSAIQRFHSRKRKIDSLSDQELIPVYPTYRTPHVCNKLSFEYQMKIQEVQMRLKSWETELNRLCKDEAPIYVENDVDLEGPPDNFTYIDDYKADTGIVIPDDPLVGCECDECILEKKKCCGHQSGGQFAYTKNGRVRVPRGSPIYECNKRCKCGPDCPNRVVQYGRKYKLSIFRTANGCGWGVKAMENIWKDTFVMEYVGEVITNEEAEKRGQGYDAAGRTYLFDLDYNDGDCPFTVDAASYGNISHFMNHSCDPNLAQYGTWINNLDPRLPRIAFFAVRQIKKGEELTFDYMMTKKNMTEVADGNQLYNSSGALTPSSSSSLPILTPNLTPDQMPTALETSSLSDQLDTTVVTATAINLTSSPEKDRILCKCGTEKCRKYLF